MSGSSAALCSCLLDLLEWKVWLRQAETVFTKVAGTFLSSNCLQRGFQAVISYLLDIHISGMISKWERRAG